MSHVRRFSGARGYVAQLWPGIANQSYAISQLASRSGHAASCCCSQSLSMLYLQVHTRTMPRSWRIKANLCTRDILTLRVQPSAVLTADAVNESAHVRAPALCTLTAKTSAPALPSCKLNCKHADPLTTWRCACAYYAPAPVSTC
jgi:hypothetical protein